MRSRDGNNTFSLSICAVILFSSLNLCASEYLISYRYIVKNAVLYNDSLEISKAMKKCKGEPSSESITLLNKNKSSLKDLLSQDNSNFIEYIHKLGLDVRSTQTNINYKNSSSTILTLKTTCFKVDFNENFARIAPLK